MPDEPDFGELSAEQEAARAEKFDRWLAVHDREVAARAWDEGEIAGDEAATGHPSENPYRSGSEGKRDV